MMKTTRMINFSPFDDIVIQCDTLYNLYWNVYHVYLSICCRNIFLEPKSHGSPKRSMPYFLELGLPRNACVDVFDPSRQNI